MNERADFHIRTNKALSDKAKDLSGLSNREIYEFGCKALIEQNQNPLDIEIVDLNETLEKANELTATIRSRLRDKEVPTPPNSYDNNEDDLKRNHIPLDLLKEMVLYYMDDFGVNDFQEISNKNKSIFQFVLINIAHYNMKIEDLNELYEEINSD